MTNKKDRRSGLFFCGGGWTRTTERIPGQIYSLLQLPLCDSPNLKERFLVLRLQKYGFFPYLTNRRAKFFRTFAALKPTKDEIRFRQSDQSR